MALGLIKEKRQKRATSLDKHAHKKRYGISGSSGSSGSSGEPFYISQDPYSCKRILPEVNQKKTRDNLILFYQFSKLLENSIYFMKFLGEVTHFYCIECRNK